MAPVQQAGIVGFAGLRQVPGAPPGALTLASAAETADRVAEVRRLAGGRRRRPWHRHGHSSAGDQEKARAILSVPGDHQVAYLLGIGYPADRPLRPITRPNRRPLHEVVHDRRW